MINKKHYPFEKIKAATHEHGVVVDVEFIAHVDTLISLLYLIRPWGQISSIGVLTGKLELNGLILHGKNVTISSSRFPVTSIFEEALELLVQQQSKVQFLCEKKIPLLNAPQLIMILSRQGSQGCFQNERGKHGTFD